ncbi:hypothetical protein ACH5RR_006850 [Cinchona calisaya]|uniref:Uncharacterized protein n=1 Tax=Cinchona calisaya TaxID=153742 RepID=A0ABD3AQL7_9GENT
MGEGSSRLTQLDKSLIPIALYDQGLVMHSIQGAVNEDKAVQNSQAVADFTDMIFHYGLKNLPVMGTNYTSSRVRQGRYVERA